MTATRQKGSSKASKSTGKGQKVTGTDVLKRSVVTPDPEEIARAAYRRWLRRGGAHGSDMEDWFEAEKELAEADRGKNRV